MMRALVLAFAVAVSLPCAALAQGEAGDLTLEQAGGGCSAPDNAPAWNRVLAEAASTTARYVLRLRPCTYAFTTPPKPIATNLIVEGAGFGRTTLARNYTPAGADDPFIAIHFSYGGLRDLDVAAARGTHNGTGIALVSDAAAKPNRFGNWTSFQNVRVVGGVGSDDSGTWTTAWLLDGTNAPANTVGLRDLACINCWAMSATGHAVLAHTLEHFSWIGGGWLRISDKESELFTIDGPKANSANITIIPNVGRCLEVSQTQRLNVYGAYVCERGHLIAASVANGTVVVGGDSRWRNESPTTTVLVNGRMEVMPTAALPPCNQAGEGLVRGVSDAAAPGFHAPIRGGGREHVEVYCNGSAWVVSG